MNCDKKENGVSKIENVSNIEINGVLYEEIYEPDTCKAKFVFYDDQNQMIRETDYIEEGDIRYVPIVDDFVKKRVVTLPRRAEPYESEDKLLEEIQNYINEYIDISPRDEQICAWTIPTFWLYDKLNTPLPYLRVLGDTGCGKSRFLDVVGGISYKPLMLGGSVTPAIMYRVAEKWKGTMIIDEADWKQTDEYAEVIKIINSNQPNRPILRCRSDNYDKIEAFDAWCPRIFATRRVFQDPAVESRMLTIQMKETSRDDIPIVLDDKFREKQERIRNKLLFYRLKNWSRITSNIKPQIDLKKVEPRLKQIIYPIATVFNHKQEILESLAQTAREKTNEMIEERASTLDGRIINAYLQLLDSGHVNITANNIAQVLEKQGYKKINSRTIGHRMKSFGFRNEVKNIGKETKRCSIPDEKLIQTLRNRYYLATPAKDFDRKQDLRKYKRLRWIKNKIKDVIKTR